jgi:dGTPase
VLIADVVRQSRERLAAVAPAHPDDIRANGEAVIAFSPETEAAVRQVKGFLFQRIYRHPRVNSVMNNAEELVRDLVARYRRDPSVMPAAWAENAKGIDALGRARLAGDFVAGMTDRYAIAEHRRLFDATPDLG